MTKILVDTSIWISYFKGEDVALPMFELIESNKIAINELILAELLPSINHRNEIELKDILYNTKIFKINIDWDQIIEMQTINLKNGINKVGIPDLIIAQNAIQNKIQLFENDRHFKLMKNYHDINLFRENA